MKSRLYFLYILIVILIIVVIILIISRNVELKEEAKSESQDEKNYEIVFKSKENVMLYDVQKEEVREVNMDYYLFCVTASEIPFTYELEALKAQVVVARTYLFNKIISNGEENADVCTDYAHCQAYNELETLEQIWNKKGFSQDEINEGKRKIKQAVEETQGQIITYKGQIIDAVFHASSPIKTENARAIWSNEDVPYLQSVENMEEESYEKRESVVEISYENFKKALFENNYINSLSIEEFLNVSIGEQTDSGRVKNIIVGNIIVSAEDLRKIFGLNSTNFSLFVNEEKIVFNVIGYGHGVGMSQVGANYYAKDGYTYDQIIHHYYTDVEITKIERGET